MSPEISFDDGIQPTRSGSISSDSRNANIKPVVLADPATTTTTTAQSVSTLGATGPSESLTSFENEVNGFSPASRLVPSFSSPPHGVDSGTSNNAASPYSYSFYHHELPWNGSSQTSFTNTFVRGILSSIDSKDPVVANAWLETLLDAIDLLPGDVIKREVLPLAVARGQLSQSVTSKVSSARLLGKIAGSRLDTLLIRQEVLPTSLALCQDISSDVRHCACAQLAAISRGVGLETTKSAILSQLVELSHDENLRVRISVIETVVNLLSLLDDETCNQVIIPLVIKSCEQARQLEDDSLAAISRHFGRLCHGLTPNLQSENKKWMLDFYAYLCSLGRDLNNTESKNEVMPDLVLGATESDINKMTLFIRVRRECAFNFPSMILFVGPQNFPSDLLTIFVQLASDSDAQVRRTLATSLHEVSKMVGQPFADTRSQIRDLFADNSIEVLEAMIGNMVHVIDALARIGVLQFGGVEETRFGEELSEALLKCEEVVGRTLNWRLHADCLEKFSCLANCINPKIIHWKFVPLLFERMIKARPLPCRTAAARTLLVILRFTIRQANRSRIMNRLREEIIRGKSCHTRLLFIRLCEIAISLFSANYFKQHFFLDLLSLHKDPVANVRIKLCTCLAKLKSLLVLPNDKILLQRLEKTVRDLLVGESDQDVRSALQKAIDDLDKTELGVTGVPNLDVNAERENERKLREEKLIYRMEEQMKAMDIADGMQKSPDESSSRSKPLGASTSEIINRRMRSESLPPSLHRKTTTSYEKISDTESQRNIDAKHSTKISQPIGEKSKFEPHTGFQEANKRTGQASSYHFSMSLENLDPSAKEFLVDAGVTLDAAKLISSGSLSMPNLSRNGMTAVDRNLSNDFSNFLISNAEMEKYEEEYQKASAAISGQLRQSRSPTKSKQSLTRLPLPNNASKISSSMAPSSPSKCTQSDPNLQKSIAPPKTSPSKLAQSSSDKLQGSIERLAEKWEAKRKNLISSLDGSVTHKDEFASFGRSKEEENRAAVMEQRLLAIKQQMQTQITSPAKPSSSILTTTQNSLSNMRMTISDQMGMFGKYMLQKKNSPKANALSSDSDLSNTKNVSTSSDSSTSSTLYALGQNKQDQAYILPSPQQQTPLTSTSPTSLSSYVTKESVTIRPSPVSSYVVSVLPASKPISPYIIPASKTSPSKVSATDVTSYIISTENESPSAMPLTSDWFSYQRGSAPDSLSQVTRTNMRLGAQSKNLSQNNAEVIAISSTRPAQRQSPQERQGIDEGHHEDRFRGPPPYQRPPLYNQNLNQANRQVFLKPMETKNENDILKREPPLPVSAVPNVEFQSRPFSSQVHKGKESEKEDNQEQPSSKNDPVVPSRVPGRYTRLPPPRYRPHVAPAQQRRPLSHQEYKKSTGIVVPSQFKDGEKEQQREKSLSAECIFPSTRTNGLDSRESNSHMNGEQIGNERKTFISSNGGKLGALQKFDRKVNEDPSEHPSYMQKQEQSTSWQGTSSHQDNKSIIHRQYQQPHSKHSHRPNASATSPASRSLPQPSNQMQSNLSPRNQKVSQIRRLPQPKTTMNVGSRVSSDTSHASRINMQSENRPKSPHFLNNQREIPQLRRRSANFTSASVPSSPARSSLPVKNQESQLPRHPQSQPVHQPKSNNAERHRSVETMQNQQPLHAKSPRKPVKQRQPPGESSNSMKTRLTTSSSSSSSGQTPNGLTNRHSGYGLPAPGFISKQQGNTYR